MLPHPIHPRPVNHPVKQLEMVVGGVKGQEGNRREEPPTERSILSHQLLLVRPLTGLSPLRIAVFWILDLFRSDLVT